MHNHYYGFTECIEQLVGYDSDRLNQLITKSYINVPWVSLKQFNHVFIDFSDFKIYTNRIIKKYDEYSFVFEIIDIRLLTIEERDNLIDNLVKETLNEGTLKMYRKYTALKNITN